MVSVSERCRFDSCHPHKELSILNYTNMITKFAYKGHEFQVVPIEGNTEEFIIIKDGRQTRKVTRQVATTAMQHVDKLFKP